MTDGDVETFYLDRQWHNRVEGTAQVISSDYTLAEAMDSGRDMARVLKVAHLIRDRAVAGPRSDTGPLDIPG